MRLRPNRREFLRYGTLAGAGFWVAGGIAAAAPRSPNEKLNIGIVGVHNRGRDNMNSVKSENIVALCDIDDNYLAAAAKQFPEAKTYNDWRKLLDQKGLDAVVVSTADQVHALASTWAMKRGLSVYCEKPLAHSVHEARVVRETYLQHKDKVATQMGTQIHATDNYRRVVELVQSGAIGKVTEAHAWCGRHGPGGGLPQGEDPLPPHLHWDLWLGPAPYRPYNKAYLPGNLTWNRWWDFGNGTLGDMGSHVIDLPFWALKLRHPTTVEAHGDPEPASPFTNAKWMVIAWEHPAVDDRPALKLTWYDGVKRPQSPPGHDLNKWGLGVLFVGDKGMLLADYGKHILLPEDKFKDFKRPEPWLKPSRGHHQEWIHACKTGEPTTCNFDYSGLLVEHNLLGNVSYRAGKKLEWDPVNLKATNCPEADQFIRRKYREGWTLACRLDLNESGEVTVVRLRDRKIVEDAVVQEMGRELFQLVELDHRKKLVLNFSLVDFLSSAAMGKLITLDKKVKARGGALRLCEIRPEIREVLKITKLDRLFDIREKEADALAAF